MTGHRPWAAIEHKRTSDPEAVDRLAAVTDFLAGVEAQHGDAWRTERRRHDTGDVVLVLWHVREPVAVWGPTGLSVLHCSPARQLLGPDAAPRVAWQFAHLVDRSRPIV